MAVYIDQLNRQVEIGATPARIVSLVPSQTELLFDLGLDAEVIGITKFCVHPEQWFRHKTRVGGTKQVNIDKVRELKPDLIIANKEENTKEQVEALEGIAPVWISDVNTVESALNMIRSISSITARKTEGAALIEKISQSFLQLEPAPPLRAAYLIWKDPCMTIGGDTFIHDIMRHAGLHNIFGDQLRYPLISLEDIRSRRAEVLVLPSEPYPFKEKDRHELQAALPGIKVLLADGEMFSWYGSRMQLAAPYLRKFMRQVNDAKS
jgi:ABC-type Fe3+-hydroxamate transport system substrate-binding protein